MGISWCPAACGEAVVRRAAPCSAQDPGNRETEALEALVFEHCVKEKIAQLQEQVTQLTGSKLEEFEAVLMEQLQSLQAKPNRRLSGQRWDWKSYLLSM